MKNVKKKIMIILLLVFAFTSTINVYAAGSYTINGVTVRYTDFSSSPNECWIYANNIYKKIWGTNFTNSFSSSDNMLRNLSDGELTLTIEHLKTYVSNAALGSCLRICNSEYLHGGDGWGHSQIIVQKDANGFTVLEGGLSAIPYCREKYYTWSTYCNTGWLGGTYQYIKYIKWPGAPAYSKNTDPLTISNIRVSNVTSDSYTVSCNVTRNVTRALFPTWPSADDSGNPIWHEGTISGNTASCVIKKSDHGNKSGDYITHIYIYDSAGNSTAGAAPLVVMGDTQAPVISNIRISEIKMDSYTIVCKVYDNGGVTSVKFPTWPSADDSGEPIWHEGTINGDTASCVIKKSDHGNKTGLYLTHIYAYDMNGNMTAGRAPGVIIGDTEPPVIENIKITNITEESYTITCTVKDNNSNGTITVRFPTWPSADDSGEPIWHDGTVNGDTASCTIRKSDHGNKTGTYISHIYAYDAVGNSSAAAAPAVELGKKHQHDYVSSIKKPATCIESGIMLYTCKDNDDSYEEEIPATGHQHTELRNVSEATCLEEGYTGDTYCKDCGTKLSSGETIAKTEHTWDSGRVTKPATDTESGTKTYTCTSCNTTRTEEIPATGEHPNTEIRGAKSATCLEEGYTGDTYCKDCGIKLSSGTVIPKTGHIWDEGTVTKAATCTEKGIRTYTCSVCESTKIEEIPSTGHGTKITKFVKEATYTQEGYTGDIYCQDCGALLEEGRVLAKLEQPKQKAMPGEMINDKASNGVYKVLADGCSVEFVRQIVQSKAVKIPDTISIDGTVYTVTGISANAFKNNQLLRTAVIGRNVRRIGKQAFYNCKNLRTITIRTSMLTKKNVGAKAFKGTYKKVKVKVPAKQFKTYKKFFKSKGMGAKAIYKK